MKKILLYIIIILSIAACQKENSFLKLRTGFIEFSTSVNITAYNIKENDAEKMTLVMGKTENIFKYFDKEMNPSNKNSTLSKLNNEAVNGAKIPSSLKHVIYQSESVLKETEGYFDYALLPVINEWGFLADREPSLPDSSRLDSLLKMSGRKSIYLSNDSIKFLNDITGIGLGAIAKGSAVDSAGAYLYNSGIKSFIVEAGGDMLIKSDTEKTIGVRHPRKHGTVADTLYIKNGAVATSGDYEKYFIKDNKRYCHLLNPFTGYSDSDLVSVTIIAENAALADAYATAVFVMGREKGSKFIREKGLSGILFYEDSEKVLQKIGINTNKYKR